MPGSHEITQAIPRLRTGDDQGADVGWQRYFSRLVSLARRRLNPHLRHWVDEEDVAVPVQ